MHTNLLRGHSYNPYTASSSLLVVEVVSNSFLQNLCSEFNNSIERGFVNLAKNVNLDVAVKVNKRWALSDKELNHKYMCYVSLETSIDFHSHAEPERFE